MKTAPFLVMLAIMLATTGCPDDDGGGGSDGGTGGGDAGGDSGGDAGGDSGGDSGGCEFVEHPDEPDLTDDASFPDDEVVNGTSTVLDVPVDDDTGFVFADVCNLGGCAGRGESTTSGGETVQLSILLDPVTPGAYWALITLCENETACEQGTAARYIEDFDVTQYERIYSEAFVVISEDLTGCPLATINIVDPP